MNLKAKVSREKTENGVQMCVLISHMCVALSFKDTDEFGTLHHMLNPNVGLKRLRPWVAHRVCARGAQPWIQG